jgi:WD40 repeat protein
VPKGLRSFDAHDADFFLELLPGPRDRAGLPDSIRFWKTRIEETDADKTFSVGLIYGPSGCGKSSLVKAGLLPRLSANVVTVFLEATGRETAARLLSGLRKVCPALPAHLGPKESLAALRRGQYLPSGKKLLIVLDQFEQWLHGMANREGLGPEPSGDGRRVAGEGEYKATQLVETLRHCDGARVQCVLLVRDDFWMAVTRFLRALEIELVQGRNFAAADLFDLDHARKVLAALGRAFGKLPERVQETSKEQKEFLRRAVAGLAQDDKVICVRLALFAEMIKGRPWTPAALKEVGGAEGVGVAFLEDNFAGKTANPKHRLHQRAAKAVLQALLPESSSDIRGRLRSHGDLLAASGYAGRPKDFDELIHILDGELQLLTPTDPAGVEGEGCRVQGGNDYDPPSTLHPPPVTRYYQLTHDYLVRSLRDWLERTLSAPQRLWRWCRRNPEVASLTAAVVGAVLVGTMVSIYYAIRADEKAEQADQEKNRADQVASEAEANLYVALMNMAQADWENANVGRILDTLEHYRHPGRKRDPRGWEWYYQDRLCQLELRTLKGHAGKVFSVAFSPDGSRLASGSNDGTIKIWDTASGQVQRTLKGHSREVWRVAFSPDGSRLASGSDDGTIQVWDTASGQVQRTLTAHSDKIWRVAFSPDGSRLASGSADGTIKVWDVDRGQEMPKLRVNTGQAGEVWSVAFSPDGSRLAAGSADGTIKVWDAAGAQEPRTLKEHSDEVSSMAFSPDGSRLASGSWDQTVKVWDATTGQVLRTLKGHTGQVYSVAFSPDGSRLASGSDDQTIKVWDAASGRELHTLMGHTNLITSVAFSPDGSRLASGSDDQTIKVWDAAGAQEPRTLKGHTHEVGSVAFSPTATGHVLQTLEGHDDWVTSVAFSPDGSRLASGSFDKKTIPVLDAITGQMGHSLEGHTKWVRSVAFSPDGRLASGSWDETIKVWDAATGQEPRTLVGHTDGVRSVAFSRDGTRLASASNSQKIMVWDVATGQVRLTLEGHTGRVMSVSFSPDGSRLASGSPDRTIKIWDATSGGRLRTLKGHTNLVRSVDFSRDGRRLASGSADHTIQVWDARPWTPELRRQREALGLVEYLCLCQKLPSKEKVAERIRAHKSITEEIRHQALGLLEVYWPRHVRAEQAGR